MIKKYIINLSKLATVSFLISVLFSRCTNYETNTKSINILPLPKEIKLQNGLLLIQNSFSIDADPIFENERELLKTALTTDFNLIEDHNSRLIQFSTDKSYDPDEYVLSVNKNNITIKASNPRGIFYGTQSLIQLMEMNKNQQEIHLPICEIKDWPSFKHRGMLMDCCRHFFDINVIKKYIDLLAYFKMNTLHWHLTEDQGWRIEIEKYPLLTEIGSKRKDSTGIYEGYYTKKEIKEIIDYAAKRHINIIPEIEFPGHSQAAIASYPQLSCTGNPIDVATEWGVFKDIYCAGNDSVFRFMEDVLKEVIELFPSPYIHIGGDEAPKTRWENCSKCQKRMKVENLKDEHELQSYFIRRIEKYLNSKGKVLIGWDEILEGGLAKNAIVQSWRGMNGGIEAAKHGSKVIMSPTSHAYFDYSIKTTDLKKVYAFDPIPSELDSIQQKLILGGECNLWSEHIPNENQLDKMAFPRLLAMSEVLWSYPKERKFDSFLKRVDKYTIILKKKGVHVGLDAFPCEISTTIDTTEYPYAFITPGRNELHFEYRWNSDSSTTVIDSTNRIQLNKNGHLKVIAKKDEKIYGDPVVQHIQLHKGLFKKIKYNTNYSQFYEANRELTLVDGQLGSKEFRDGDWQGFWNTHIDFTIDLEKQTLFDSVSVHFYQYINSWIFSPIEIAFNVSNDSVNWTNLGHIKNEDHISKRGKIIDEFSIFNSSKKPYRYINLVVTPLKVIPDWHEAAGNSTWLFVDEIIVK